jgi:hypothetical protein
VVKTALLSNLRALVWLKFQAATGTAFFYAPVAVVLKIKAGPYEPRLDREFPGWAPPEDDAAAARFVTWLATAALEERVWAAMTYCSLDRTMATGWVYSVKQHRCCAERRREGPQYRPRIFVRSRRSQ